MGITPSVVSTPTGLRRSEKTKSVLFTFEDYTEDAPDDRKIKEQIAGLRVAIINHARDYHHQRPISFAVAEIENLLLRERELFPNLSTIEFAQLLCNITTRRSAITGLISHMALKNIGFYSSKVNTLLPASVVGCIREFEIRDDKQFTEDEEMAFAQWRAVTAHLLPKLRNNQRIMDRVDRLMKLIDDILINFHEPQRDNQERLQGLTQIVYKTAMVGEMIFASPSRWEFDWNPSRRDRKEQYSKSTQKHYTRDKEGRVSVLVRFPGLVQTCTEDMSPSRARRITRSRGDYDDSPMVKGILEEVRSVTRIDNRPSSENVRFSASDSHLSSESPCKPERGHQNLLGE